MVDMSWLKCRMAHRQPRDGGRKVGRCTSRRLAAQVAGVAGGGKGRGLGAVAHLLRRRAQRAAQLGGLYDQGRPGGVPGQGAHPGGAGSCDCGGALGRGETSCASRWAGCITTLSGSCMSVRSWRQWPRLSRPDLRTRTSAINDTELLGLLWAPPASTVCPAAASGPPCARLCWSLASLGAG